MNRLTRKLAAPCVLCVTLASLALPLFVLGGCLGQQARDRVLYPVFTTTLPRVIQYASAAPNVQPQVLDQFSDALTNKRYADALTLWPQVRAWGDAGIDAMQAAGKVGPVGAGERHETMTRFDADLRKAARL